MAGVGPDKEKYRVWIDSQTEDEIIRGIREAKPLSEYDNLDLCISFRAMEDYLMGINFSRVITLKYGNNLMKYLQREKYMAISVGRVMTCVLGMVVKRERRDQSLCKDSILPCDRKLQPKWESSRRRMESSKRFETF